jgi:hypothetical protein
MQMGTKFREKNMNSIIRIGTRKVINHRLDTRWQSHDINIQKLIALPQGLIIRNSTFLYVLLTVHLSIILAIDQLNAHTLVL